MKTNSDTLMAMLALLAGSSLGLSSRRSFSISHPRPKRNMATKPRMAESTFVSSSNKIPKIKGRNRNALCLCGCGLKRKKCPNGNRDTAAPIEPEKVPEEQEVVAV